MRLSDEALELLDSLVELGLSNTTSAASGNDILNSLDIKDLGGFAGWLRELIDEDYILQRRPKSIREIVRYYVNMPLYNELSKFYSTVVEENAALVLTDWDVVRKGVTQLNEILESSALNQSDRAQAGAILSSVTILIEAPDPPKQVLRNLLYDLAALATLFALAIEIADKIK